MSELDTAQKQLIKASLNKLYQESQLSQLSGARLIGSAAFETSQGWWAIWLLVYVPITLKKRKRHPEEKFDPSRAHWEFQRYERYRHDEQPIGTLEYSGDLNWVSTQSSDEHDRSIYGIVMNITRFDMCWNVRFGNIAYLSFLGVSQYHNTLCARLEAAYLSGKDGLEVQRKIIAEEATPGPPGKLWNAAKNIFQGVYTGRAVRYSPTEGWMIYWFSSKTKSWEPEKDHLSHRFEFLIWALHQLGLDHSPPNEDGIYTVFIRGVYNKTERKEHASSLRTMLKRMEESERDGSGLLFKGRQNEEDESSGDDSSY